MKRRVKDLTGREGGGRKGEEKKREMEGWRGGPAPVNDKSPWQHSHHDLETGEVCVCVCSFHLFM